MPPVAAPDRSPFRPLLPQPSHAARPSPRLARILPALPLEDLACAALFAFFAMQGSIPGIAPAQALEMTGSAPTSFTTIGGIATQALANALILLLLLRRPRLLLRNALALPCLALLALLAVASTAWSLDPTLTLRRSIPFALAGLFGLWFALRFPPPRQRAILRFAFLALALATIALVVLAPAIGLDHSPGHAADWQGVFTQKNACGRIMVLATAVLLFAEPLTALRWLSLALFLFVLFMSGSRGAWIVELVLLLLALALEAARRVSARARTALLAAAPLAALALAAASAAFYPRLAPLLGPLLGRDPTLSGRTAIWSQAARYIADRPLAGYGYEAFWRGMTGPSLQIDAALHFVVEHAHNGYLEILLEFGLAGLLLFLFSWVAGFLRLWPLWRQGCFADLSYPLAFLLLIALYSLDENTLLIYNGIFWPLYAATLANLHRARPTRPLPTHPNRPPGDDRHAAPPPPHAILTSPPGPSAREEPSPCPAP